MSSQITRYTGNYRVLTVIKECLQMCKKAHADGTALPAKRFGLAAKSDPTLPTYVHTVMKDGRPTLAYTNKRTGVRQGFQTGTYEQMKALAIAFAEKQQVPPANQENSNTVMNQIHSQASDISTTGTGSGGQAKRRKQTSLHAFVSTKKV